MGHDSNGEKKLGAWIMRSINLILHAAALALMAYMGMWLKANVPSKQDFKELQGQVQEDVKKLQGQVNGLDKSIIQLSETNKRIEDFELRIRKLEQGDNKRFPPPRREL